MNRNKVHKSIIFKYLILTTLSITTPSAFSQIFSADQNPPTLKWKQINTDNFQLIYPLTTEKEAQKMANTLESIIVRVSKSLNKKPKKISIILQNQGTSSNGFVQLAPRRSEFYMMPSQAFDFQNWLNSLAVHELRHVVQFDKLTGKYNSPVFESLALSIFGIVLPPWFYEGDAVNIETALTKAGRGRQPEWNIYLRSALVNDQYFSYSKNYFGSYKDFTPGYYQLGNYMNANLRRNHGSKIMDNLFSRMASLPIRPYNLSNSIKKFTGSNSNGLHTKTMTDLAKLWKDQIEKNEVETYASLNKRPNNTPSHFFYPTATEDQKTVFLKTSKAESPAFYIMDKSGKSRMLFRIGNQEDNWFSYASGKLVWDEYRTDPRYQQRSFNVICIYNLKTKKAKQLTHRSRLFAPSLSADGKTIAAVDVNYSNEISLVELDAESGKEIKRYKSPGNYMLQMPSFNSIGDKIVLVGIATTGKTLLELDRKSGTFIPLLPLQLQEILKPIYAGDQIVFKAHYNGIDNIYRLDKSTGEIFQLTSAKLGAFNPSYNAKENRLLFNHYTTGYDIAEIKWDPASGKNIKQVENTFVDYNKPLYEQEGSDDVFDTIPSRVYQSKRYSDLQFKNLFYFHSIYPLAGESLSGVELRSDNKLNTIGVYADYLYNSALRKSEYAAGIEFKRYYPQLSIYYSNEAFYTSRGSANPAVTGREGIINAQVSVPFRFNRFNQNYNINFLSRISHSELQDLNYSFKSLATEKTTALYQLSASRNAARSSRDLYPKFAQALTVAYRHLPFNQLLNGDIWTFRSTAYFPGLFRNHSLSASFNWQTKTADYMNENTIPRISGYAFSGTLLNPQNTVLINYRFPVFYPDWELGPLAYIKRVKAGFFSDFQDLGHGNSMAPKSYGFELRTDVNLLRFYLPNFDIGERIIFLNEKTNQNPIFEFMLSYTL